MIDQVINYRYEILEKIGEGTFFAVYKARDRVLNKLVAVKTLLPQYANDKEFAEKIRAEATSAIGLSHANIARIYESGEHEGVYFTVVEYIRGTNLKERIRRVAPLSVAQAIDVSIGIAEALMQAHQAGIVHGDLRPHNVIITPEGQIKVTDFGITPALIGGGQIQSNAVLRHVHYMSPEAAEGKVPQPSSDIYSLGVILYEMLTGVVPFDGETPIAIALKHVKEQAPSPRNLNPGIPKAVEGIVLKALSKDPEDRYESAEKMLRDLRSVRDALRFGKSLSWSPIDPSVPAPPTPEEDDDEEPISVWGAIMRTVGIVAGFLLVVFIAGFVYLQFFRPKDIQVPDVTGKSAEVAEQELKAAGFSDIQRSPIYDEKTPADTVLRTAPEAGRSVKQVQRITLIVSKGPQYIQVPDVTGALSSDAKSRLESSDLKVSMHEAYSDRFLSRHVISQDPGPGNMVAPQTQVKLVISKGSAPVEEPAQSSAPQVQPSASRNISIHFEVPPGDDPQHIRIDIEDSEGTRTIIDGDYSPGELIQQKEQVKGQQATVRYYRDDQILKEEIK